MIRKTYAVTVFLVLAVFLATFLQAGMETQNQAKDPDVGKLMVTRFEPMAKRMLQKGRFPGLTIAVVHKGKIVYSKAFGVKNIDTGAKMSIRSLFHQASVTKPFVATAIMQLVEQGKVNLDDPVTKYLPYFKLADKRYKIITVRQMVTHTSGMPDVRDYEWDKPVYDDGALERYVRSLSDKKLIFAPGESMRYSNMAFEVLGDLIAKVSGKSFEDYVQENILTPLNMKDSTLLKKKANPQLMTTPHILKEGKTAVSPVYPYNRMHAPSSTLISNVMDMSRWAMANLNHGHLEGKRILKESTYDIIWNKGSSASGQVGISWFIGDHNGIKTISHGGGDTGYRSYILLLPEKSLGIVLAFNFDMAPVPDITQAALHAALGEEYVPLSERKAMSLDPKVLEGYVGHYRLDDNEILMVTLEGGKLFAQTSTSPKFELFAESESMFFLRVSTTKLSFKKNDKGEVFQAVIHQNSSKTPAKKIK
jgi:CubicO group peptidase (beta-lactamase class C family)